MKLKKNPNPNEAYLAKKTIEKVLEMSIFLAGCFPQFVMSVPEEEEKKKKQI